MNRPIRMNVTQLEDRSVPATFGYTWVNADNITYSVVPDGTDVNGVKSTLKSTLGATMTESVWSAEIQNAFQSWANVAAIEISPMWDSGDPLGTSAPIQGSSRFGDIRLSARPLSRNVLAITNPPDLMSPWAGEIILNSDKAFTLDGAKGTTALRRVLLQEVGHALGVANSTVPGSVMYEQGGSASMNASDVAAIQALYGPRLNDRYEGKNGNNTIGSATELTYISSIGSVTSGEVTTGENLLIARAGLTAGDVDYYSFKQPSGSSTSLVSVLPQGISLVRPRVQVFDEDGKLINTSTPSAWSNNNYVMLSKLKPGSDYTIRVDAEPGTPFAVGGYRIGVGSPLASLAQQMTDLIANVDGNINPIVLGEDTGTETASNDTRQTATDLGTIASAGNARWDLAVASQFSTAGDVDTYKIRTKSNTPSVMLLAAWSADGATPDVTVTNAKGTVLKSTVLTNSSSANVLQIEGIKGGTDYYISIRAASFGSGTKAKSYRFGIDFRPDAITLPTLAAGTLSSQKPQLKQTFTVTRSQGFQFTLSATDTTNTVATAARFTVFNAAGTAVFTIVAKPGESVSGLSILQPGNYTVIIVGASINGSAFSGLKIDARFVSLTDPIGPMLAGGYTDDTTANRTSPPTSPPPTTISPPPPLPSTADDGYIMVPDPIFGTGFLTLNDPYSDPWW